MGRHRFHRLRALSAALEAPELGTPIEALDTPAVLVDLDRLERNLARMAARAKNAGVALRPHAKTHKSAWIGCEQVRHGARGLTVAKLGEAEAFVNAGVDDILVAFPIVGADKLRRLRALAERCTICVALDDIDVARGISGAASGLERPIDLYVEVDCGQHRSGVPTDVAVALARDIGRLPNVRLRGFNTHAGHSYKITDREQLRTIAMDEARALAEAAEALGSDAPADLELSLGSTPTAHYLEEVAAAFPQITESRPGTYVFNDGNQVALGVATEDDCSLTVLATIVSRPAPDRAIADAGSKTLAGDGPVPLTSGFGAILGEPRAAVTSLSEEHAWIRIDPAVEWRIGDRVQIIPNHACPVPNLADVLLGVRNGAVERVIPVDARGRNS